MINRRKFIKNVGLGALSTLPLSSVLGVPNVLSSGMFDAHDDKHINIGIIGAENNHSRDLGKFFNINKFYPGVEVSHIWGETRELAEFTAKQTNIPNIVDEQSEMMGKVNALIVDHRDGKYHLDAAYPFIEKGIPSFVDKPFCITTTEGVEFLKTARKYKAPVTSLSTVAHTRLIDAVKVKVEAVEKVGNVVIYGPGRVHSKYNGVYYYVVHCLQTITRIFGDAIVRVRVTGSKKNVIANLEYDNGFLATIIFVEEYYGFNLNIETNEGLLTYKPTWETERPKLTTDLVTMFRTGKEPRTHQSILNEVSTLEAIDKSLKSQNWEEVKYQYI